MNQRVLFVDDEPNVLQAIKRAIRKDFDVATAEGPEAGLALLAGEDDFAVIVSDMRMPGMSGVEFLRAAKQLSPRSVGMMLTGNADQQTAIDAVNDGAVFRFLTKPCDVDRLRVVVSQALDHYRLLNAERELLEETLQGSLGVMSELLAISRPDTFGRTRRLRSAVFALLEGRDELDASGRWVIETAIMLSQLGVMALPEAIAEQANSGQPLNEQDRRDYEHTAVTVADMLARVPRMAPVADIIRYQHKHYDGSGSPADAVRAEAIPLGARALHLAQVTDALRCRGFDAAEIDEELRTRRQEFDPRLLKRTLETASTSTSQRATRTVAVADLDVGMALAQDLCTEAGSLIVCEGQRVTPAVLEHVQRFMREGSVSGACVVLDEPTPETARAANY
ncbi:MAG: HD domain-containing phosphohydrolase [Pseudomonadota bacterium]